MVVADKIGEGSESQRLMRGGLIIPVDPPANHGARLCETLKLMLPEILFFQASEEEFNKPILLQRIRGDEFLSEPIVPTHQPKPSAPKDQTTVTAQDHRSGRPQGTEPSQTGYPKRLLGLLARPRNANSYPMTSRS